VTDSMEPPTSPFSLGGVNASGQVPQLIGDFGLSAFRPLAHFLTDQLSP